MPSRGPYNRRAAAVPAKKPLPDVARRPAKRRARTARPQQDHSRAARIYPATQEFYNEDWRVAIRQAFLVWCVVGWNRHQVLKTEREQWNAVLPDVRRHLLDAASAIESLQSAVISPRHDFLSAALGPDISADLQAIRSGDLGRQLGAIADAAVKMSRYLAPMASRNYAHRNARVHDPIRAACAIALYHGLHLEEVATCLLNEVQRVPDEQLQPLNLHGPVTVPQLVERFRQILRK